eukprot:TRINITY_DN320_c0_g1_i4.p1 TRINITY_DN320_c0_g1~~TRINITY_DN320_c0_g1_i4.p1  ORF type:complete len:100 (-),score=13.42 TRINITY_DN320_c0_g1_i4:161-460(-)
MEHKLQERQLAGSERRSTRHSDVRERKCCRKQKKRENKKRIKKKGGSSGEGGNEIDHDTQTHHKSKRAAMSVFTFDLNERTNSARLNKQHVGTIKCISR